MTNAPARGWSGSMQRWWSKPRNRRIALVTGVLLVIVWTVALIAIARDTGSSRRKTGNLTLRRAGPSDSPAALWLFGFDTLRLDPDKPSTVEQLGLPAFGDVGGTTGGVLLYDTGSGRFGFLDATRNRIVDDATLPADPARAATGGTITGIPPEAWVVTRPGTLLRHPLSGTGDIQVDVAPGLPGGGIETRVAGDGTGIWSTTASSGPTGGVALVARLDTHRTAVAQTATIRLPTTHLVEALAGRGALWLVTPRLAIELDAGTLQERQRQPLGTSDVLAATLTEHTLVYVNAAGEVGRLDVATGRNLGVARRFDLSVGKAFVHLAATGTSLWALVGTNTSGTFQSELVRFDASARPVFHLALPSNLAIADLAISTTPPGA
jgi:hypothetical protein